MILLHYVITSHNQFKKKIKKKSGNDGIIYINSWHSCCIYAIKDNLNSAQILWSMCEPNNDNVNKLNCAYGGSVNNFNIHIS